MSGSFFYGVQTAADRALSKPTPSMTIKKLTKRHVWGDYYVADEDGTEVMVCTECGACSSTPNDDPCPGKKQPDRRKCRMCGHPMSDHGLNVAGEVYCRMDGCTLWIYCGRKEKKL